MRERQFSVIFGKLQSPKTLSRVRAPSTAFTRLTTQNQIGRNLTRVVPTRASENFSDTSEEFPEGKFPHRNLRARRKRGNDFLGNRSSGVFPSGEGVPPMNPKSRGAGGPRGEGGPAGTLRKRRLFPRRAREIPAGNFVTRFRQKFSDDLEPTPAGSFPKGFLATDPAGIVTRSREFPDERNNSRREFPEGIPGSRSRRDRHAPAGESLPT